MNVNIEEAHEPLAEEVPVTTKAKLTPTTTERMRAQSIHVTERAREVTPPVAGPLKVAIIGTAPSSRDLAPFDDPSWEIWGTSPGNMGNLKRVTRWIEIHSNLLWPENQHYGAPYLKWLNEQTFPIWMQSNEWVPRAITFPKDELVAKYGAFFFTSTFAWAMALAMEMGAVEIGLFGVDMASRDEYILQRPGGHYFIEQARQKGIKVVIPSESDLAQPPPLYGFSHSSRFGRKIEARKREINGRIAHLIAERDRQNEAIAYLKGAQEDIDYIEQIWSGIG